MFKGKVRVLADSNDIRESDKYRKQVAQLIIGLKFHYGQSLQEIPLDVAVDAMVKVWESCQKQKSPTTQQGIMNEQPRRIPSPGHSPQRSSYPYRQEF